MRKFVKWSLVVLALAAGLACSTGAYADTLSWSVSGTGVSGSGMMTATNEGGGEYLVTGMTGNITITVGSTNTGGAITGFTPFTGTLGTYETTTVGLPAGDYYQYDDLVYLSSSPALDTGGLIFNLNGYANPLNICSGAAAECNSSGSQVWLDDLATGLGDKITFSATLVPEPSVMGLLSLGLLGLMLGLGRERLRTA